jgi:hypothetical protein
MPDTPLRDALDSGRLLRTAFLVATLEVVVRLGVGIAVHPFLYLLTPPVVAVVGVGRLAPGIRTRILGERHRYAVDSPGRVLPRLLVVAVVGHVVAVALGFALFLVVDTPLQATLYWLGIESRPATVALAWPVIGLLTGTAITWALPAMVAAGVSEGLGLRRATRCAFAAARRRDVVAVVSVNLLGVIGILLAVALGAAAGLVASSGRLFFALAGSLTVLFATPPLAVAIFADLRTVRRRLAGGESERERATAGPSLGVPVSSVVVVAVLVLSLATLSGAARMTELRPMESPEPLGDDPDRMYATALENTLSGSYTAAWVRNPGTDSERAVRWQVDRGDRQLLVERTPSLRYVSTGVQTIGSNTEVSDALRWVLSEDTSALANGGAHTPPNYFRWAEDTTGLVLTDPPPDATGWERVGTDGDEVRLELTDRRSALAFVAPTVEPTRLGRVNESTVRAVVDTESRTLTRLDIEYDARIRPGGRLQITERYSFEQGTDVKRPEELGSPGLDEHVWRLLLY